MTARPIYLPGFFTGLNKPVLTLFDVAGQDYVVRGLTLQRWLTMARRAARP